MRKSLYTWVPSMCWMRKVKRYLAWCWASGTERWGQRLLASPLEDRIQFKSQQFLKSFACSLGSLNERHFRCGEKLKWKLLHENISFGRGELFGKILIFLRNKEKLMKGFEVIMTKVSTASLCSSSLLPKWRRKWGQRNKCLKYSKSGRPSF